MMLSIIKALFSIISVLPLCIIDALLALILLEHSGQEVNPVMAYLFQFGPYTFFVFKYLLTIMTIICLLMFRKIAVRVIKLSVRSVLYIIAVL